MTCAKSEVRSSRPGGDLDTSDGPLLVTRRGLAMALGVSLRTVDRMLADGEIAAVRVRGWSVRFYVPDVVEALRNESQKWGRKGVLQGTQRTERIQA